MEGRSNRLDESENEKEVIEENSAKNSSESNVPDESSTNQESPRKEGKASPETRRKALTSVKNNPSQNKGSRLYSSCTFPAQDLPRRPSKSSRSISSPSFQIQRKSPAKATSRKGGKKDRELKREIERIKQKLVIYEGENSERQAINAEEDRKRIKKIFDMFDTDGSGDISQDEVQDLAYRLGETLTTEEIKEFMKKIDTSGNGTVDFNEFYVWWKSNEHDMGDKSEDKLRILKMKLTSKAYLRALHGFSSRINRMQGMKTSTEEAVSHLNVDLLVGKFQEERSSVSLRLEKNEVACKAVRDALGAPEMSLVISMRMVIREGVDDFAIGELSGKFKNLLFLLDQSLQLKTKVVARDQKRFLEVSTYFANLDYLDSVVGLLDVVSIQTLEARLSLSERPWKTMTEMPKVKFTAKAEIPRKSMSFLKSVVGEERKESSWDLDKLDWFLLILKSILSGRFHASFHDFGDLYQALGGDSDIFESGWSSVRQKVRKRAKEVIKDPFITPSVLDAYYTLIEMIEGVEEFKGQIGNYVLILHGNDFPLMDLLPNRSELKDDHEEENK